MLRQVIIFALLSINLMPAMACPAMAQRSDFQVWSQLTTQILLDQDKKWLFYFEAQPRLGDEASEMERLLIRPALGYNLNKDIAFYLGYGWTPTYMNSEYDSDFRNENRIWQQLLIKQSALGLDWQLRVRQEQRWIDDTSGTSNRFRTLVRGSYKFGHNDDFGLTGYNEIFVSFNSVDGGPESGFDRDRFFFGPFWQQDKVRYEAGYLGEYARKFGNDARMINALMVGVALNF